MSEFIVTIFVVAAGSIVQGCTGFGLALLIVPPLLLFMPQTFVIPMVVLLGLMNTSILVYHCRGAMQRKIILPLIIGAIPGVPVGTYFLGHVNGPFFKIGVGVFIVAVASLLIVGWVRPVRNTTLGLIPVGLLSGFLHGSITVSGPPVLLFLSNQGVAKDVFRGTLAAYFLLINIVTVASFFYADMWKADILLRALICSPLLIAGTIVGSWLSHRIPEQAFRRGVLVFAIVMGCALAIFNTMQLF